MLHDAALDALALLLPVACAGCGTPDRSLCGACRAELVPAVSQRRLRPGEPDSPPVVAGLAYDGVARRAILALKDGDRPGLALKLAPALAAAARDASRLLGEEATGAVLCPIPSSRAALRRRGYAPVALLARAAGLRTVRLLAASPGVEQKALGAVAREANARARFRRREGAAGLGVVLLDDVVTTGATLRAAARELQDGGAQVLGAVVLAARLWHPGPDRHGPRPLVDMSGEFSP